MLRDEKIDAYLSTLFGNSEPGGACHSLLIARAPEGARDALGVPAVLDHFRTIAPDATVDPDEYVSMAIARAIQEARAAGEVIHFAGLATELNIVLAPRDPAERAEVRRLRAARRLSEHADAVEVTRLYAACRDGRRWVGEHVLTGPEAGRITGPTLQVSSAAGPRETGRHAYMIRLAVGMLGPTL